VTKDGAKNVNCTRPRVFEVVQKQYFSHSNDTLVHQDDDYYCCFCSVFGSHDTVTFWEVDLCFCHHYSESVSLYCY